MTMIEFLSESFVQNAIAASLIIGLFLSYLGVHVVGRGIVFVDLALGQISMLGIALANYLGYHPTLVSITFTMVAAFFLSLINVRDRRLKQEAIIGIIYAVASAATVLLIAKSPHGDSDISEVLFGSLFTVSSENIVMMCALFGALGLVHLVFRRKFFEMTEGVEANSGSQPGVFKFWNFLFFLTVGLSIVFAVRAGGVIPVFSYLIIPPVSAILVARSRAAVVVLAMLVSVLGSVIGVLFALQFDFPAGSSIVAMLGLMFACFALIRFVFRLGIGVRKDPVPPGGQA
jgi:zinc/manganese transport system permease protein